MDVERALNGRMKDKRSMQQIQKQVYKRLSLFEADWKRIDNMGTDFLINSAFDDFKFNERAFSCTEDKKIKFQDSEDNETIESWLEANENIIASLYKQTYPKTEISNKDTVGVVCEEIKRNFLGDEECDVDDDEQEKKEREFMNLSPATRQGFALLVTRQEALQECCYQENI